MIQENRVTKKSESKTHRQTNGALDSLARDFRANQGWIYRFQKCVSFAVGRNPEFYNFIPKHRGIYGELRVLFILFL